MRFQQFKGEGSGFAEAQTANASQAETGISTPVRNYGLSAFAVEKRDRELMSCSLISLQGMA
jgi:hypothetical protein